MARRKKLCRLFFYVAVAAMCLLLLMPYLMMLCISLNSDVNSISFPPQVIPEEITLEHWIAIFDASRFPFLTYFANSFYIAGITALITVVIGVFSGYALARTNFKGRTFFSDLFFFIYMFSGILLLVPLYKVCVSMGLTNTREAVILCMVVQTMPTAIYMTQSYFSTIPRELEEAGRMDGLNRLQVIFSIMVPLSIPGIISVFVYAFMVAWNDVLFVQIFLDSSELKTLTIGLKSLFSESDYSWGRMMAASIATAFPIVVMYGFSQHLIKSGLTAGGVKE